MKHLLALTFALSPAVALAQEPVDAALENLARVKPGDAAAYSAARDRVLSLGATALPALREQGAPAKWTAEGWVKALAAETCRVRIENPKLAGLIDQPKGLDPAVYRKHRKPEPHCAADFAHAGLDTVPILLERWRWTYDQFRFSEGRAGEMESDALRQAILFVPGQLEDRRAEHFLRSILADRKAATSWRQAAAVSLGQCAGADALADLTGTLDNREETTDIREACARALGRVPSLSALETIRTRMSDPDRQVGRSLLTALGLLGSSWAWEARGASESASKIRQGCAELLVGALRSAPDEAETIGRALVMMAWPDSLKAVEALATEGSVGNAVREAARKIYRDLEQALRNR